MSGIYVHIPFCRSKCAYCDFYSTPGTEEYASRVARAIGAEWDIRLGEIEGLPSTLYLGGGTPSALADEHLRCIAEALPAPAGEFTMEANPDDVSVARAEAWRSMGVNRVSMGAQSFIDAELKAVGRRHTARQTIQAVADLRSAAITNLSLDLIYGLPGQTLQSWRASLKKMIELRPDHISAYTLTYEPGTRLTALLHAGKLQQASDELIEEMYLALCSELREAGYAHYEISNFALPGREARHNSAYWDGTPYLGLGPSAHSFDGTIRRINPPSINEYLQAIEHGASAYVEDEEDDDNRFNDKLITALRTSRGLDLEGVPPQRRILLERDAQPHLRRGNLIIEGSRLIIPEHHWLLSDTILRDLMQV